MGAHDIQHEIWERNLFIESLYQFEDLGATVCANFQFHK